MINLNESELKLLSFPDTQVTEFKFDLQGRMLQVKCTHAYLGVSPSGHGIENVTLELSNFEKAVVSEYKDEKLTVIPYYTVDFALKDICEFSFSDRQIQLKGFSMLGYWTEYSFENAKINVRYE